MTAHSALARTAPRPEPLPDNLSFVEAWMHKGPRTTSAVPTLVWVILAALGFEMIVTAVGYRLILDFAVNL